MKTNSKKTKTKNPYATLCDKPIRAPKTPKSEPRSTATSGGDLRGGRK